MKPKPFKFQEEVLEEIDDFGGRVLCSLQMGLGKTLIALWWLKKHHSLPAIIVCPASLKYMWQYEAKHILNIDATVLEGRTPHHIRKRAIVILNYDILKFWLSTLYPLGFKTLIMDESHACKSPKTQRTKACLQLSRRVPYVMALSGTPLTNRPIELFPVLNMLRPNQFNSLFTFGRRYCGGRLGHWGWEFKGATRTQELHNLLKDTCMTRRLKSEVLKDLPPKNRCILPVPMRNPEEYEEATNNFLMWLAKQDPLKVLKAQRAETLVQLGYLKRLAAKLKAKYVVKWVNQWLEENEGEKLVLFAEHKAMIKVLRNRCRGKYLVVDGSTPTKLRYEYEQQFQKDKSIRLFIANRRAGGVGLTLTAASALAFTEMDWVPGNHTQAEDRIHRIGQEQVAWIYYFVAMGSIEEKLCVIIQSKQKVLDAILDGGKVNDRLNVYDKLMASYKKDGVKND